MSLAMILLALAFACFVIEAIGLLPSRVNLIALGLALLTGALIAGV